MKNLRTFSFNRADIVLSTNRLQVRIARPVEEDVHFLFNLWTHPQVMKNVGFPNGLKTSHQKVKTLLEEQLKTAPFDCRLIVIEKSSMLPIGEAKLGSPDTERISETDVKFLPEFWGKKYGVELKEQLLRYLFTHTHCRAVKATPNIKNVASIKMQEDVGGIRIREFFHEFPESMKDHTQPVIGYVYLVTREAWEARQASGQPESAFH